MDLLQDQSANEHGMDLNVDWRIYEVGTALVFHGYAEHECHDDLVKGDIVVVEPDNPDGMGIAVKRISDGYRTFVWPEEVGLHGGWFGY